MSKRNLALLVVLSLIATVCAAGCTTSEFDYGPAASTEQASSTAQKPSPTLTPTPIVVTVTVTVTATPLPTPMPTPKTPVSISGHNEYSTWNNGFILKRGQSWYMAFDFGPSSKRLCDRWLNFYIDTQPAGGEWRVGNSDPTGFCWVSASLSFSKNDTLRIMPGQHVLTVDWLGDDIYAPAQLKIPFTAV